MRTGGADCGLIDELGERACRELVPFNVTFEITLRCNLRCVHCYNFDRERPRPDPGAPELSFAEIVRILGELREAGTLFLGLTGGEAMAHPRFWDVCDAAAERRFAVTVLANGTLLTPEACARLARYPNLWGVSVSLYGATAAVHDAVTKSQGSFDRTMAGVRRVREMGTPVLLKYVVLRGNAHETGAALEAAAREDFEISVDTTVTGRYDGTLGSLAERAEGPVLEELYRGPLRDLIGRGNPDPTDDEFKCPCARGNAGISATGDVYPCIATPLKAGNLRERSFGEIWRESPVFRRIRSLRIADFKTCAPCGLKPWCRRTPSAPTVLHGDFTGVDPWVCREAEIIRDLERGRV